MHCKTEISEEPSDEQCAPQVIADNTEYMKLELQSSGCHMKTSPSSMGEVANKGTLMLSSAAPESLLKYQVWYLLKFREYFHHLWFSIINTA